MARAPRSKTPELVEGSLPEFQANVVQPADPTPFNMNGAVTLNDDGSISVAGVNVHRAVSPAEIAGYIPTGTVLPGGGKVRQS
ncbi:hypothetical protein [Inquilinus limosus]|uniref:hypothetical protein n=1 Tax=Inquilinus limosus TaxID=171674 RepID=UPI000420908A|nr:hypothetical protein [Inquilinus limosus]